MNDDTQAGMIAPPVGGDSGGPLTGAAVNGDMDEGEPGEVDDGVIIFVDTDATETRYALRGEGLAQIFHQNQGRVLGCISTSKGLD